MDTLQDFKQIVKFSKFIPQYTTLDINGGVTHRSTNKGTNDLDKQTSLKDHEIEAIDLGIGEYIKDLQNFRKKLKSKK